jgi:SAM-dependent methyltransferase
VGNQVDRRDQLQLVDELGISLAGSRILEMGCSQGDLLSLLRERDATVVGVEPSHIAREIARSRGLEVVSKLENVPAGVFDTVILFDVLEHLPDPRSVMRWIGERLSPAGRVVIGVPNICSIEFQLLRHRWFALELPRHLTHFSPLGIDRLARTTGLLCRHTNYLAVSFFTKSFVDPRLRDGWFLEAWPFTLRAVRIALSFIERVLWLVGNRPYFVTLLEKT